MRRLAILLMLCGLVGADAASKSALAKLNKAYDKAKGNPSQKYKTFRAKYMALAEKHAGTDEALSAKLWLVNQAWWLNADSTSMHDEAGVWADQVVREYKDSPRLGELALYHYVFSGDQRRKYFDVLAASKHAAVRAAALYQLGRYRALLTDEYKDIAYRKTTYGTVAHAHLNKHDHSALEEGKVAPEIEGINHKGQKMKLSDFRGKVVVLDFWGDW